MKAVVHATLAVSLVVDAFEAETRELRSCGGDTEDPEDPECDCNKDPDRDSNWVTVAKGVNKEKTGWEYNEPGKAPEDHNGNSPSEDKINDLHMKCPIVKLVLAKKIKGGTNQRKSFILARLMNVYVPGAHFSKHLTQMNIYGFQAHPDEHTHEGANEFPDETKNHEEVWQAYYSTGALRMGTPAVSGFGQFSKRSGTNTDLKPGSDSEYDIVRLRVWKGGACPMKLKGPVKPNTKYEPKHTYIGNKVTKKEEDIKKHPNLLPKCEQFGNKFDVTSKAAWEKNVPDTSISCGDFCGSDSKWEGQWGDNTSNQRSTCEKLDGQPAFYWKRPMDQKGTVIFKFKKNMAGGVQVDFDNCWDSDKPSAKVTATLNGKSIESGTKIFPRRDYKDEELTLIITEHGPGSIGHMRVCNPGNYCKNNCQRSLRGTPEDDLDEDRALDDLALDEDRALDDGDHLEA